MFTAIRKFAKNFFTKPAEAHTAVSAPVSPLDMLTDETAREAMIRVIQRQSDLDAAANTPAPVPAPEV